VKPTNTKVIYAGKLIHGTGSPPVTDAVLVVEGGTITNVGPEATTEVPSVPEEQRIDARAGTVLPGLIDSHLHLVFNARTKATSPAVIEQIVGDDDTELGIRAAQAAQACLGVGITTVRDCGGRGLVTLRIRDLIAQEFIHGPRVLACGMPITTTAGHCHWLGLEADNVFEVITAARQMVGAGADFIKVMATGGGMTVNSNVTQPQYSAEELGAIAREAHRLGRRVAAHSHAPSGHVNCLEGGIDMIEHCNWHTPEGTKYDPEIMKRIVDTGTYVGITLSGPQQFAAAQRTCWDDLPDALKSRYEILHQMRDTGAKIAIHSDAIAPITRYEHFPHSVEAAVFYGGFSAVDAIHACTGMAAEAIGIDGSVGTLERGKEADILIVDGDVTADITAIENIQLVMRAGEVVAAGGSVRTTQSGVRNTEV
jgi:imidazolonepropionase-like amidohydrolase